MFLFIKHVTLKPRSDQDEGSAKDSTRPDEELGASAGGAKSRREQAGWSGRDHPAGNSPMHRSIVQSKVEHFLKKQPRPHQASREAHILSSDAGALVTTTKSKDLG